MKYPYEDPTWPGCSVHIKADGFGERHWCEWTRNYLLEGQDGPFVSNGIRCLVPLAPDFNVYAEVALDVETVADIMCKLFLVKEVEEFGTNTEELISLGLHTFGEGRLVIGYTMGAWIEANTKERCTSHHHSYPQEMKLQQGANNPAFQRANQVCLALFDKCHPCWASTSGQAPPPSDFGMGGVGEVRSSAQSTLQQLNQQFGSKRALTPVCQIPACGCNGGPHP